MLYYSITFYHRVLIYLPHINGVTPSFVWILISALALIKRLAITEEPAKVA
jgi:hypothetical protein